MRGGPAAVRLLEVPVDSGHVERRMGAGPAALAAAGAAGRLRARGHRVTEQVLLPSEPWRAELATAFDLVRQVAGRAAEARAAGEVPLLLSGNCNTTLGVLAAVGADRRIGLVWLDAHGDFNTPDEDTAGFLDGHGLAVAVGRCWRSVAGTVPGFRPLPEGDVLLVGARDLTDAQRAVLRASAVRWLGPADVPSSLDDALDVLAGRVDAVHFHVDLDVHDPSIAPANGYAAPDGLSAEQVRAVLARTAERVPVVSGALASYDPAYDPEGRLQDVALTLLEDLAARAVP